MGDAAVAVAEFGAEQWGLITSAQARALGVTAVQMKRLADRGALDRVHHGIYRMTRITGCPSPSLGESSPTEAPHNYTRSATSTPT